MTTILISRPEEQGRKTAERLAQKGFETILTPAITIARVDATLPDGPFQGIMVTSGHAVDWLGTQSGIDRSIPVLAVGDRTAAAARQAGFSNVLSAGNDRTGLEALVRASIPAGARLLAPVGRDHHEDVPQGLRRDGYTVETPVVYAANFTDGLTQEAIAALRYDVADAVLHYSTRSASAFIALMQRAEIAPESLHLRHICLSQQVADALPAALKEQVIVADRPDEEAMIDAAVAAFAPGGSSTGSRTSARPRKPRARAFGIEGKAIEGKTIETRSADAAQSNSPTEPMLAIGLAHGDATGSGKAAKPDNPAGQPESVSQESNQSTQQATMAARAETASSIAAGLARGETGDVAGKDSSKGAAAEAPVAPFVAAEAASGLAAPTGPVSQSDSKGGSRIWPIALAAGLTGGIIGAAAAVLLPAVLPAHLLPANKVPDVESVVAAQVKAQIDSRPAVAPASGQLDVLQKAIAAESAQRSQALSGLKSEVDGVSRRVAEIAEQARKAGTPQPVSPAAPPVDLAPLEKQLIASNAAISELRSQLSALAAKPAPDIGKAVRAHAMALSIASAVQRSAPFKNELDAAAAAGVAPAMLQPLAGFALQGAPSGPMLAKAFESVSAKVLVALEPPAPAGSGLSDRLKSMMSGVVRVRPVGQASGDSPGARVAQIEAALARSQFADAAKSWLALPDGAKSAAGPFGPMLLARFEAETASRALVDDTTRALARQGQ